MKYDKHLKKLTHKERKSLMEKDVQENKQLESYYFKTEKEAKDFQKFTNDLKSYKDYI